MNDQRARPRKPGIRKSAWMFFSLFLAVTAAGVIMIFVGIDHGQISKTLAVSGQELPTDTGSGGTAEDKVSALVDQIRLRMVVILTLCMALPGIILFFLVRRVIRRLEDVGRVAEMIAGGNLKATAKVDIEDEIGKIASFINDLSANLQEVFLFLWNHSNSCISLLDQTRDGYDQNPGIPYDLDEKMRDMRYGLQNMQAMIKTFEFYDISLENGKVTTQEVDSVTDTPLKGEYHD